MSRYVRPAVFCALTCLVLIVPAYDARSQTLVSIPPPSKLDAVSSDLDSAWDVEKTFVPPVATGLAPAELAAASNAVLAEWQAAERFTRQKPEDFDRNHRLWLEWPDVATKLATSDKGVQAVLLSVLAQDPEKIKKKYADLDSTILAAILDEAKSLDEYRNESLDRMGRSKVVAIFADGTIRGVTTGESDADVVGTGALGVSMKDDHYTIAATITIASSRDTVTSDYGTSILAPGGGNALASGLLDARLHSRDWWQRLHFYGSANQSDWLLPDSSVTTAVAIGFGALLYKDLVSGMLASSGVRVSVEAGWSFRWLTGDVANQDGQLEQLGITERFFTGPELGMQITFGRVTAALQFYYYWSDKPDPHIDGLTHGQLSAGINIAADVITGRLN